MSVALVLKGGLLWPWQQPFTVTGGTTEQRAIVMAAYKRVTNTVRGRQMLAEIRRSGDPVKMAITSPGVGWSHVRLQKISGSPRIPTLMLLDFDKIGKLKLLTTEGWKVLTIEQYLAHELGHFVFKVYDTDVRNVDGVQRAMKNVLENENPIRKELGYPPRCAYYIDAEICEPGF